MFGRLLAGVTPRGLMIFALIAAPAVMMTAFFAQTLTAPRETASLCPPAPRMSGEALIGGDFSLTDHTGRAVTAADFRGEPMIVFFGYTFCPDVCPFALQAMTISLDMLPEADAARFRPVFISVDPERDTVEAVAAYVESPAFPDRLVGLTGTPEQIAEVAEAYRVVYRKAESEGLSDYLVDHSSFVYLMDSEGDFTRIFRHGESPATVAACLQDFLEDNPPSS